jgi:hypothetical protein
MITGIPESTVQTMTKPDKKRLQKHRTPEFRNRQARWPSGKSALPKSVLKKFSIT